MKVIGNESCQETGRWLNNRAENSHQPFRRRGMANGTVQRQQDPAKIRLRPCFDPQPLQPSTPSQPPRYFQTNPSRCSGRVVSTCSLKVLDCRFFSQSDSAVCTSFSPGTGKRTDNRTSPGWIHAGRRIRLSVTLAGTSIRDIPLRWRRSRHRRRSSSR